MCVKVAVSNRSLCCWVNTEEGQKPTTSEKWSTTHGTGAVEEKEESESKELRKRVKGSDCSSSSSSLDEGKILIV